MSSDPRYASISPSEMKMVQSVLDDAGYDANVLAEDQSLFNTAALLVMKLFLAGETSPYALTAQLERNFGKAIDNRAHYKSPLPRYAIQGLPHNLSRAGIKTPRQPDEPDVQTWENEGGAVSKSPRRTLPIGSKTVVAVWERRNV
ncbi:hypothetical protein [Rhizobium sp. ARZ01]|uniref:hypothetical protein n=1 Tax=Rhizobium sp. ARZ01 TaxID=2769313 RepID=UPI001FEE45D7|nr:hypothetical protein [Rhizobium sp. ARZ01]